MAERTDLPSPHQPFTLDHEKRWPIGVANTAVVDGEVWFGGTFDERDVALARRAFPGFRVTLERDCLIVGPVPTVEYSSEEWTDEEGVRWHRLGNMRFFQRPGESFSTLESPTPEERRDNRDQSAADRAETWAEAVTAYTADPNDITAAWRYLIHHPIFYRWELPREYDDITGDDVDEAMWARIESEGHLLDWRGLDRADTFVSHDEDGLRISIEHGPILWPLDVPAGHRYGMSPRGVASHDHRLDVTAPTWEDAVVGLAQKVREHYGDDRAHVPQ